MSQGKIRIQLRSFDSHLIDQNARDIVKTVKRIGLEVKGPIPLPTKIQRYTVLRSPHVDKESREQFEMLTHKRIIDINNVNQGLMNELTKLELSAGVDVVIKQK